MNLKEALRLSSPQTAKKSNNRPSHRRPAGITRGGLAGVPRRRTETGGTLLPCAAPPPPPPPPPSKHYQRDDSGYDGRRGGYGPPDRRKSGYYSYGDERPPGRFMGRYQDWEGGRGSYGDASNRGSTQRYQEYKSEYITTQKRVYFNAHKEEELLEDKYHLTNLLTVIEKRNEHARKVAKDFLLDLQSGNLDLSCSDRIE